VRSPPEDSAGTHEHAGPCAGVAGAPSFGARLHARIRETRSSVCLGIDPRPRDHPFTDPQRFAGDHAAVAEAVVAFYRAILEACSERLACVKPQAAFFEALGIPGLVGLAQLIEEARALGLPVILDGKRGDIGSTADAYAGAYLGDGVWASDALTVSPYLGPDTLEPFTSLAAERGRGVYVLVATSNAGAGAWQDQRTERGPLLHELIADHLQSLARAHGRYGPVGAVVGATRVERLAALRARMPDVLLLVPGFGAQGGTARDVAAAFDPDGLGAVVNASRSLQPERDLRSLGDAARDARRKVTRMGAEIRAALEAR
jgi:orotidine-5'-phosphate decarboxylase